MIRETSKYKIEVDVVKNIYHVKIKKGKLTKNDMKEFVDIQIEMLEKLKPNISVISDMSEAEMISQDLGIELSRAQEFALKLGIRKDARIVSKSELANLSLKKMESKNGLNEKLSFFENEIEAKVWLNL